MLQMQLLSILLLKKNMLTGIQFTFKNLRLIVYNKFKNYGKVISKDKSVCNYFLSFKNGHNNRFSPTVFESIPRQAKNQNTLKQLWKIVEQPFKIETDIPSSPTDLQGLRPFIAFKTSHSEIGGNCRRSLDNRAE